MLRRNFVGALSLVIAAGACSDASTAPSDLAQFSERITLERLVGMLDAGPARVEIELIPGSLIAREVEIKTPDEMTDEESIRAPVSSIATSAGTGTLTLDLGSLEVTFGAGTRLRDDDEDLSFAAFVARVEAILANGATPFIRAKRGAASPPQAPDDASFAASEIRLRDEADEPEIELNVDADNLTVNATPPPDAILTVLGLPIELRVSTGETELESDLADDDEEEFEGLVQAVDVGAGTVTLVGGTVVRVVTGTRIERDDDEHLGSLQAVAEAIAAGAAVEAEGEGIVESLDPLTIVAREVEFEIEDDEDDDGNGEEFEAAVQAVDVDAGTVTLADGTLVRLTPTTIIEADGDLLTLQAVADALAAGAPVRAEGEAVVESSGPPSTLVALSIEFEVDD